MILHSVAALVPDMSVLGDAEPNLHGWHSERPEFAAIVKEANPKFVVEVGAWVGQGTLRLAQLCPNAIVIAVDHFLGLGLPPPPKELGFHALYRQFLRNIVGQPEAERIFPLVQTSRVAASLLKTMPGAAPDLIYIDGDHGVTPCYEDISLYYPLLATNGVIFGDDFEEWDGAHHPGVAVAVRRFCLERKLKFEHREGFWKLRKP